MSRLHILDLLQQLQDIFISHDHQDQDVGNLLETSKLVETQLICLMFNVPLYFALNSILETG